MSDDELKSKVAALEASYKTLADGKWQWKKDGMAIATILGSLSWLVFAAIDLAQRAL